jgi:hypothetical protein
MRAGAKVLTGKIISGLMIFFLLFDAIFKLIEAEPVRKSAGELGYPESSMFGIGLVLLLCVILYAARRTSVLGALLLTGYLGGAVATHVRIGAPIFPIVFSVGVGVLVWLGLFLREERLAALLPLRTEA